MNLNKMKKAELIAMVEDLQESHKNLQKQYDTMVTSYEEQIVSQNRSYRYKPATAEDEYNLASFFYNRSSDPRRVLQWFKSKHYIINNKRYQAVNVVKMLDNWYSSLVPYA